MAKITIDPEVQGIEGAAMKGQQIQKAFEVALTTIGHLDTVAHLVEVEIIKVSWKSKGEWKEGENPLVSDFQVVFRPFSGEKLRAVIRFEAKGTVLVYEDDPEKDDGYITTWVSHPVEELEAEDIVELLLKAMEMVAGRHELLHTKAAAGCERFCDWIAARGAQTITQ